MAGSESFHDEGGQLLAGGSTTSFSELLFSNDNDDDDDVVGLDNMDHTFDYSSTGNPHRMLCFGGYHGEAEIVLLSEPNKTTPQKSGVTCSDSSSVSSGNKNSNTSCAYVHATSQSHRKRNLSSGQEQVQSSNTARTPLASQRTIKKTKTKINPTSTGHAKVRKEKLGERISALQQLVSPFGKTDTASVLHEAMGYIKFLQDQVQVLCSPYLQHLPVGRENGGETKKDLRSRGLCLVPVECTIHIASSNGVDYWSPATMGYNFSSSSSTRPSSIH